MTPFVARHIPGLFNKKKENRMTATCPTCNIEYHGLDRDEDGAPYIDTDRCASPGCETYLCQGMCEHLSFHCADCRKRFCDAHKFSLDGEPYCLNCAAGALEMQEPECECRQSDVDLFDAAGCGVHDSRSPWNVRMRAVSTIQQYEAAGGAA